MPTPELLTLLLLGVPLAAALAIAFFLRRWGRTASAVSVLAAFAAAALAAGLVFGTPGAVAPNLRWLTLGDFGLSLGFLVDDLAKLMLAVVAFVGLLIHAFSLGYMDDDPHKARFFGGMSFFMFSMLGLTMADNLVSLFIFWELVGASSWLLIGFHFDRPSAVAAANKAFIVNRVGDFGFVLGIVWAWWQFGTVSLTGILAKLGADPQLAITPIALLLFCGAVGKSGQVPLHVWLPDAMEGPTPVSALIHAATMVAAGIYLLCRIAFLMTPAALDVVLSVGVTTALFAGLCAVTRKDIKKILAYSTVSQLGYMVAAFALGSKYALGRGESLVQAGITAGAAAAMFHLATHAFFKALLFLGAGSVIHGCHHEQNIFRMGGLWRRMPVTFLCFTAGFLALVGAPWTSGFFSKDAILLLALQTSVPVFCVLACGALLTALYMTRLWIIVFFGRPKSDHADMAHESPAVMTIPLAVLAVLALVGGAVSLWPEPLGAVLRAVPEAGAPAHATVGAAGTAAFAIGLVFAMIFYRFGAADDRLEQDARPVFKLLAGRLWFDEIYLWYVHNVQDRLAQLAAFLEHLFISGLFVRGSAAAAGLAGLVAKATITGDLHTYVAWFFAGLVILWWSIMGN